MNVFFDTSSLFKLYHRESGTEELMILFNEVGIEVIYLAEITKVEFSSAVWKNCRKNEIDLFLTSDNLLSEISQIEGLPTK